MVYLATFGRFFMVNVGENTIHGWYGNRKLVLVLPLKNGTSPSHFMKEIPISKRRPKIVHH